MRTFEIGFFERSTRLTGGDLAFIVAACNAQLAHDVAPAYGRESWSCVAYADIPPGAPTPIIPIRVLDDIKHPGAIGFHSSFIGMPWGRVEAPTDPLDGTTFSHEAIEAFADPELDQWRRMPDGREMAYEPCDPCQRDWYYLEVRIGMETRLIRVSDAVLPSYWQADGRAPFTVRELLLHQATINRPFGIAPGGYAIVRDASGKTSSIYARGDVHAEAALHTRASDALSRSYRRGFRG